MIQIVIILSLISLIVPLSNSIAMQTTALRNVHFRTHQNGQEIPHFRMLNRRKLINCPFNDNPYLKITTDVVSTLLDEQIVTVTVSGVLLPSDKHWVAMISPSHSSVNDCLLNTLLYKETGDLSHLPLLCHYPVKNQRLTDLRQRVQGWSDQSLAYEVDAYLGGVARSPWVDPPATMPPTLVMRSPHEVDAEHEIPPVRQRRHPRTREEARATQQAYNAQHQHQHQQEVAVPQQWYQDPEPDFPQYQVQQGVFMGLEGLNLDDLNWEQIQNIISDVGGLGGAPGDTAGGSGAGVYGGVGGSGDGGSAAGVYNSSWGGYDHCMTGTTYPSGGGYDGAVTGTTYPRGGGYDGVVTGTTYLSGGGYDGGMTGTTYLSGGGYDGGMTGTTYPSGGGYDGAMTGTTYGCGVGTDGDGLDLSLSLRFSDQSAVVDASQSVYRTPEQELRRLTGPVGRRDSNQHVRPTQGIGFGTRPRRIFTPEPNDEDE